jgi:fido (protein-threonine AMPylation protein)
MNNPLPNRRQEDALRFALAINRGMQLLDRGTVSGKKLTTDFAGVFTPSTKKSRGKISDVYASIHETLFGDWQGQAHLHPEGYNSDIGGIRRGEVATMLHRLLHEGNHSLILPSGFARTLQPEQLAGALAGFYHEMSRKKPFAYGNRVTLELFLTALLDQDIFKNVEGYQGKIDFRRLTEEEKSALRDPNSTVEELTALFTKVTNPSLRPLLAVNDETGFPVWSRREVMLKGTLFLAHEKEGEQYVVTANGGLVKQDVAERLYGEHLAGDGPDTPRLLADFHIPKEHITGYLPETEHLRESGKAHIDGFKLREDGAVPLVCLEQDIITGLRQDQKSFEDLFNAVCTQKFPGEESEIFRLAHNNHTKEGLFEALLQEAGDNKRLRRAVEVAYDHVSAVVDSMDAAKKKIFEGKSPTENPVFYMAAPVLARVPSNS